jgi:2-methylcitrate dehydratase PrpD
VSAPSPSQADPGSASVLQQLAQHAQRLTREHIPPEVLQQARLCVLDTLGCMLAGTRTAEAELILRCEPGEGTAQGLSVYGTGQRRPWAAALRINAYLGDVLELNDLIGGHASIGNVTAALGAAEANQATLGELLEAVVRGIEITTRLYDAVYPSLKRFTEVGLVPVGLPSAVGAAAAVAHLQGLDEVRSAHAMAIGAAQAGWCPAEVIFGDGGSMKPLLFGAQPAVAGFSAARYAAQGMTGPLRVLDSPLGYFNTVSRAPRAHTGPWTDDWALLRPRRKLHACCGYLHSAVDAVAQLLQQLPGQGPPPAGLRVELSIPPYTCDAVVKDRDPLSPNDARFHLQFNVALALCGADVIAPEHSIELQRHLARPEVRQAMAAVRVRAEPGLSHYEQCRLLALGPDGSTLARIEVDQPRGSPTRPLSPQDVVAKFQRLAEPVLGAQRTSRAIETLLDGAPGTPVRDWLAGWQTAPSRASAASTA